MDNVNDHNEGMNLLGEVAPNKPRTKLAEYIEKRLLHFEDCQNAIDQLLRKALAAQGTTAFEEFLGFISRFNRLSVYNAMLVRIQRPGASAVGTPRAQWKDQGRTVHPDAVPVVILRAFGPVQFLYELSDTEGDPIPGEAACSFDAEGEVADEVYDNTIAAAFHYGIEVMVTQQYGSLLAGTAAGKSVKPEQVPKSHFPFRVKLNAHHTRTTRFATLAHELGHIYCGHLGGERKGRWPNRSNRLSEAQEELEAEAVAWLVCQRNGITSRSKEYLGSLISEEAIEGISMYAIFEAANRVESRTPPQGKKQ